MGPEGKVSTSSPPATAASPSGKRSRDPEDEVYVDNLHSHKRYLSEIMASSLNSLTVGDPLPENLMDSPVRSDSVLYLRDDISLQYSPMSEDSDDSRCYESSTNACCSQQESVPTSPVSPYRCQKPPSAFVSGPPTASYPSHGSMVSSMASPQPRQRGSDTENRFPSSPSDICHSADLRRAALLRSVQMRTQPSGSGSSQFELSYTPGQECGNSMEAESRPCSYVKTDIDERGYRYAEAECAPPIISESESGEKPSRTLIMDLKEDEPADL